MALMSRDEAESLILQYEQRQARLNGVLARREIGPGLFWEMSQVLEKAIASVRMELTKTALVLQDRSQTERSKWFAWVVGCNVADLDHKIVTVVRKKGPLLRYMTSNFRESSQEEIQELIRRGVKVMSAVIPPRDPDRVKSVKPAPLVADPWIIIPVSVGKRLEGCGVVLEWGWWTPDGSGMPSTRTCKARCSSLVIYYCEAAGMAPVDRRMV